MHGLNNAPSPKVEDYFKSILDYPGFKTSKPSSKLNALKFWSAQSSLDFPDCYHFALTEEPGMPQIYSYDKKMDRYPGVERIEPEDE